MWPFGLYETELLFWYICITALLLGFLLIVKLLGRDPNLAKFADLLPGPKGIPVIGNGLELFKFRSDAGIGLLISKYTQTYGSMYKLWFGNILMVVLSDPQDLEIVLFSKKTCRRPPTLADYFDDSAITTNKKWKEQRKVQIPYYSNTRIKSLIPRINDHIREFLPDFYALCGKGEFDIYDYLQYWSFNYHLKIHMNINEEFSFDDVKKIIDNSPRPLDNPSSTFYKISNILRIVSKIMNKTSIQDTTILKIAEKLMKDKLPYEPIETEFSEDQIDRFDQPLLSAIRKFEIDEKIENCLLHNMREILMTAANTPFLAVVGSTSGKLETISKLNALPKCFSTRIRKKGIPGIKQINRVQFYFIIIEPTKKKKYLILRMPFEVLHELKNQLYEFQFSANMSQILAAFIFVVAAHPDIQDKLHKELNKILDGKKLADIDLINQLTYMHRVFMETMRWQTISSITLRHLDEPLKIGSHVFPANTGLIIDFYNLHRNPKYYPDPEKIDPDRFLSENVDARPKCSFLPFSEGPRGCLGRNFALTSMKLMAIALLQNFTFNTNEKCENIKFSGGFIRQSITGYKVSLKLRQS